MIEALKCLHNITFRLNSETCFTFLVKICTGVYIETIKKYFLFQEFYTLFYIQYIPTIIFYFDIINS